MSDQPAPVVLTDADERAHAPGEERLWGESWYFDFTDREGTLGGYVRLGLYPNLGVAWYWACRSTNATRPSCPSVGSSTTSPSPSARTHHSRDQSSS